MLYFYRAVLVFYSRPFSNTMEAFCLAYSLAVYLLCETSMCKRVTLGFLLAFGVFTRFTFVAFFLPIGISLLMDSLYIASRKTNQRTIFFDADHSEIAKYMNASDIIVMPSMTTNSFKEEYGRIAPEGMGSGCLIVVSNSGTLPELVSDYGWVFPESDINALALLLKSLINNENKRDLGQRASVYARSELGLKKQASIMNKVFQDIV